MPDACLVHIGYHKTGTTWFQKRFFAHAAGLRVIADVAEAEARLVGHELQYRPFAGWRTLMEAAWADGDVPVVSAERLSGHPYLGGHDNAAIARRIRDELPGARVWIVIRNQVDAITSYYREFISSGGFWRLEDFLHGAARRDQPSILLPHFAYASLIEYYRSILGEDRVHVSFYEDFRDDPASFVADLCNFAGIDAPTTMDYASPVRRGLSDRSLSLLRAANVAFPDQASMAPGLLHLPGRRTIVRGLRALDRVLLRRLPAARLRRRVEEHVDGRYVDDNRRLADLLDVSLDDMARRGYDV